MCRSPLAMQRKMKKVTADDGNSTVVNSSTSSKNSSCMNEPENILPIPVAVIMWYFLGISSTITTKILLISTNIPPLIFTIQQILRTLLELQTTGDIEKDRVFRRGLQPIPCSRKGTSEISILESCETGRMNITRKSVVYVQEGSTLVMSSLLSFIRPSKYTVHMPNQLFLTSIFCVGGYLLTNIGFKSGSAAFVETVKAAEPFTSASIAVLWNIERLGCGEVTSLIGIVLGVVFSTLGYGSVNSTYSEAIHICIIVMSANLCFSFRGLHQKLFRSTPQGIDDLNLQFRMNQIGVILLIVPAMFQNYLWALDDHVLSINGSTIKNVLLYISISIINGIVFTTYNLTSTYLLSRISIVHHAALTSVGKVVVVVAMSFMFGSKVTLPQVAGVGLVIASFLCYLLFKMEKNETVEEMKDKKRKELKTKDSDLYELDCTIMG